jgi:prepilin-type processing-associated H-X9-DG protein
MNGARRCHGGTVIDVIAILIVLGLVGMGVWWVIKTTGQAGQQYADAMVKTSHKATAITCQSNMHTIFQNVHIYAISNEHYPESQQELVEFGGYTRLFHCPDPNGSQYVYIPGQSGDMPPTNVLVYESKPVHEGRCNVLFLGGEIVPLTPEQLKQAVEATMARLRRR